MRRQWRRVKDGDDENGSAGVKVGAGLERHRCRELRRRRTRQGGRPEREYPAKYSPARDGGGAMMVIIVMMMMMTMVVRQCAHRCSGATMRR